MAVMLAKGFDTSGKEYEFPISNGLKVLCRGLAFSNGIGIDQVYSGGVDKAISMNEYPASRHLALYLYEKYRTVIGELKEDLELT